MQYSSVLIMSIFMAGAVGGATSFLDRGQDSGAVTAVIHEARGSIRYTMRELDSSYYRRGDAYAACASAYGHRMSGVRTKGDITLSCECFDKSIRLLRGLDRDTALLGLGPRIDDGSLAQAAAPIAITAEAGFALRRCDIEPWKGRAPDSLRGPL